MGDRADKGIYLRKENKALFEKVVVKLVLPMGGSTACRESGELGTESRDMSITGHVILDSDRGDRVKVDTLNYSNKERVIRTDSALFTKTIASSCVGRAWCCP
jgi:restriction endonuclease Mrr